MGNRLAGEIHEFWFQYSAHIGCLPDSRIVVSNNPLPPQLMRDLGVEPVLLYTLTSRACPPHLPELSYCRLSIRSEPIMPADALLHFWKQARLLFGVPNTLVLYKGILQSYPSVHQLCLEEGVLPEVFMHVPSSVMHRRGQQCSLYAVNLLLRKKDFIQEIFMKDCNDFLLETPLVFRGSERVPSLSVTALEPSMINTLYGLAAPEQNIFKPVAHALSFEHETYPTIEHYGSAHLPDIPDYPLCLEGAFIRRCHGSQQHAAIGFHA